MNILETVGAAGQVASVALAIPAVFVAYFAYRTSKHSAEATAKLTEIEQLRLHAELRPQFDLELEGVVETNRVAALVIRLMGPPALPWVDVAVTVRPRLRAYAPASPIGPFVFDMDVSGQQADPQYLDTTRTAPQRLVQGDDMFLGIVAVADATEWELLHEPIRLMLTCSYEGGQSWEVPASTRLVRLQDVES